MKTIKLTLMYDGTNYVGWQVQPSGISIQALVQEAVQRMTNEDNDVVGASRTDAGVHALGQVAHFITARDISLDGFRSGLNSMLPPDIAVVRVDEVPDGFHARKSAHLKLYVYRTLISCERNPMFANRCWRINEVLDLTAMQMASSYLIGEHDFSAFQAAGCTARHAVRNVTQIDIASRALEPSMLAGEGEIIEFAVEGDGFVRHMVRNIVGTLVDVGRGKIAIDDVAGILHARERKQAGCCAPACGLYLAKVMY